MSEFIGRFHPLLVHFPIAILIIACLFYWLSANAKFHGLRQAVSLALLIGMIGAISSCITGYLLSLSGEYDDELISKHQWLGITVAVISIVIYFLYRRSQLNRIQWVLSFLLCIVIFITGHLGGTLTHGEGYLTEAFQLNDSSARKPKKIIANVQEAGAYADIIQPIIQEKCYTCHSSTKQKGGLRLDAAEWILKGGKNGDVLIPGKPEESEIYTRLVLDPLEKHHMPPKAKPQLSELEVTLIRWWIANKNSFDKKVKELAQTDKIKAALMNLQATSVAKPAKPSIPSTEVDEAPSTAIEALKQAGIIVLPVASNSNYLQANFVSVKTVDEKSIMLLEPIQQQLVWLKLANASLSNKALKIISGCSNLTRLNLEYSTIGDSTLGILTSLKELQYLNLVGTAVTNIGVTKLKVLPNLQNIYLALTRINKNDWPVLQKAFPKTHLDSGGYQVNALTIDTILVKAPAR
jgi:uncharacterized membrane protein